MWQNITSLASYFKKQKINSDSLTAKLTYRFLSSFLVASCVITISNNYFGLHIQCLSSSREKERIITANCWSQGTWIYANVDEFDNFRNAMSVAPGVHGPTSINEVRGSIPGNDKPQKKYHLKYPFLPFIYIGLAIGCQIGRYGWRNVQGTTLPQLVRDLKNTSLEETAIDRIIGESANRFLSDIRQHRSFTHVYGLYTLTNIVVLTGHFALLTLVLANGDFFFGYTAFSWLSEPYENWPHSLAQTFPQITKCSMESFGVGGNIVNHDALCFLVMNKVNIIMFALHWWILIFLIPLTCYELLDHVWKFVSRSRRMNYLLSVLNVKHESDVGGFVGQLNYGSTFVISLLAKNIPKEFVSRILLEVKAEFEGNGEEIRRRLNGYM